jgi:hypothetical protein
MRIEARLERARHFPSLTEEFVGQYFYLKLATDPSTSKYGFKVSAEYRD